MRLIFLVLVACLGTVAASDKNPIHKVMRPDSEHYYNQIRPGYNFRRELTFGPSIPLNISVSATIRNLDYSDSKDDILGVDLTLRQEWVDPRLEHDYSVNGRSFVTVSGDLADTIWHPDTVFRQALREEVHHRGDQRRCGVQHPSQAYR